MEKEATSEMMRCCPIDINNDGCINNADLTEVVLQWSRPNPCVQGRICTADVNFDCTVNIDDLTAVILSWCSYCDGCTGLPYLQCCEEDDCVGGQGAMQGGQQEGAADEDVVAVSPGLPTLQEVLVLVSSNPDVVAEVIASELPYLLPVE